MNINSHLVFQQYSVSKKKILLIVYSWQDLKQFGFGLCILFLLHNILADICADNEKEKKKEREIDTEGWKYKYGRRPNAHPKKLIS